MSTRVQSYIGIYFEAPDKLAKLNIGVSDLPDNLGVALKAVGPAGKYWIPVNPAAGTRMNNDIEGGAMRIDTDLASDAIDQDRQDYDGLLHGFHEKFGEPIRMRFGCVQYADDQEK